MQAGLSRLTGVDVEIKKIDDAVSCNADVLMPDKTMPLVESTEVRTKANNVLGDKIAKPPPKKTIVFSALKKAANNKHSVVPNAIANTANDDTVISSKTADNSSLTANHSNIPKILAVVGNVSATSVVGKIAKIPVRLSRVSSNDVDAPQRLVVAHVPMIIESAIISKPDSSSDIKQTNTESCVDGKAMDVSTVVDSLPAQRILWKKQLSRLMRPLLSIPFLLLPSTTASEVNLESWEAIGKACRR